MLKINVFQNFNNIFFIAGLEFLLPKTRLPKGFSRQMKLIGIERHKKIWDK